MEIQFLAKFSFDEAREINPECAAEKEAADWDALDGLICQKICNNWYCTRRKGHPGIHVAANNMRYHRKPILARWID